MTDESRRNKPILVLNIDFFIYYGSIKVVKYDHLNKIKTIHGVKFYLDLFLKKIVDM